METGVGKTYTYIKTMYELNKRYGWSKFIIVVPSIAIREGVYKTFDVTQEHFAEEYGTKINFFIYDSGQLSKLRAFATDNFISAMIINSQAFNARGENARRIRVELDEFQGEVPLDVIAATNPILIIDEPQSVEGTATKEGLKDFKPLMTLRYSATHRADSVYNMVYRLDAIDALEKHLVKKIEVTGIRASSVTATAGYVYLEHVNLSPNKPPTATIQFDCRGANGIRQVTRTVGEGFNLYEKSGGLDEYRDNFTVKFIDGRDDSVEFLNGTKLFAGDVIGRVEEDLIRRIQIRETIRAHLAKEAQIFSKGVKILSLFFIDEVKHYRIYDAAGKAEGGDFAKIFEEEYSQAVEEILRGEVSDAYRKYLAAIPVASTHAGYFSVDKKGRVKDSVIKNRREKTSDDIDAYNLIMRDKERLLVQDAETSPVRFIFSHSALREGWDNPNVFQICTLKKSSSEIRKRQEIGRGLRLCVNQAGERIDENFGDGDAYKVNVLTVIAGESYEEFTRKLQREISDAVASRPRKVTSELFIGKVLSDGRKVDGDLATAILFSLIGSGYISTKYTLTQKFFDDKKNNSLQFTKELADCAASIVEILDTVYDDRKVSIGNGRGSQVEVKVRRDKLKGDAFQGMWKNIRNKTVYIVEVGAQADLVEKSIDALNKKLNIPQIFFQIVTGGVESSAEKVSFKQTNIHTAKEKISAETSLQYDIIGRLVEVTGLTRQNLIEILRGVDEKIFAQFAYNPEEFITQAGKIINATKARRIIEHIKYEPTGNSYDDGIFTDFKVSSGENILPAQKSLFDSVIYDSNIEKKFAEKLDISEEVEVYAKLPRSFYISTPMGRYSPDWAIVYREGTAECIYFVVETKGSVEEKNLREVEGGKINCAKEHFKAIAGDKVQCVIRG